MKTFDKKDLITWFNRDQAEIGKEYYFASCLSDIQNRVNDGKCKFKLRSIDENHVDHPFECNEVVTTFKTKSNFYSYACILPIDAVKEEKKFRPLKNIEEFYKLVFETEGKSEEDCIYQLIYDCILHLKSKQSGSEYYTPIRGICKNEDIQILINSSLSFEDLFNEFEIEIDGEWLPFGIEE